MGHIRILVAALGVSASLLVGCMGVSGSSEPGIGEAMTTILGAATPPFPLNYVNVRDRPSPSGNIVRTVLRGNSIDIQCMTSGDPYNGNTTWYQLTDNTFVSAAVVTVSGVPQCMGGGWW